MAVRAVSAVQGVVASREIGVSSLTAWLLAPVSREHGLRSRLLKSLDGLR